MSIKITPQEPNQPRIISVGGDNRPAPKLVPEAPIEPVKAPESAPAPDERMMDLMRKEMQLREEARKLKADKDAFEQARKPTAPQQSGMTAEEWKKAFMEDPAKVGLGLQEIADRYLDQPSPQDLRTKALEEKISQLEATITQNNQRLESAQQQSYENAKKQFLNDSKNLAAKNPEQYEAIAADGAYDAVISLIEQTYAEDKVLLSVEDAMQKVEDYLTERAVKYAGLKKVRAKVDSSQGSSAQLEQKTPTTPKTQDRSSQSLTRSMVQSSKTLTPAERRERAIRIALGQKPE